MTANAHRPTLVYFGDRHSTPAEVCGTCSDQATGQWVPVTWCPRAAAQMTDDTASAYADSLVLPAHYTTRRELRGGTAHWIHVTGPGRDFDQKRADRTAHAAARAWAKELGYGKPYAVSGGGQYGNGIFRHSNCYGFENKPTHPTA